MTERFRRPLAGWGRALRAVPIPDSTPVVEPAGGASARCSAAADGDDRGVAAGEAAAGGRDAGRVETDVGEQLAPLAVLHEAVGKSEPHDSAVARASATASSTALPKPVCRAFSSTVTAHGDVSIRSTMAGSRGFTKRALTTATSSPS